MSTSGMPAVDRCARLGALEQECADLKTQMTRLQEDIDRKKHMMAPLSPLYTLPDEVVAMILKFAFQHHFPHCRLDDGPPHTNSPMTISYVSRWWRRQALSVSFIWNCIHVMMPQPPHYPTTVRLYLERSRGLPLSISFQCFTRDFALDEVDSRGWLAICPKLWQRLKVIWMDLLAEKSRWKHCSVYAWHSEVAGIITSLHKRRFPLLEYLGVTCSSSNVSRIGVFKIEAPRLTELRAEAWFPTIECPHDFPNRLTELKISHVQVSLTRLMHVLAENAGTLQSLALAKVVYEVDGASAAAIRVPMLPRLTCLVLHGVTDSHSRTGSTIAAALCHSAVALETLLVAAVRFTDVLCRDSKVFHTLRHLCVPSSPATETRDAREIINATPNLSTLHVGNVRGFLRWVKTAMAEDESAGHCIAWPDLRSAYFTRISSPWERDTLCAFVRHRVLVGKPLETFIVPDEEFEEPQPNPYLDQLRQLGIAVVTPSEAVARGIEVASQWPNNKWDWAADKPIFVPWKGSLSFHDQFDQPMSNPSRLPSWLEPLPRRVRPERDDPQELASGNELTD
ncbi:hypothetical protein PsYK624_124910 [Phanerochaete sordida]|uniref:F-box domain-containing protein n=1 Tax=Phanerochaete sordida TaxID=48140 RepID=A0A9P3LJK0_9APHY|nr:hypothetical protein PsYK624_124910 [Phanerochaete sordida]